MDSIYEEKVFDEVNEVLTDVCDVKTDDISKIIASYYQDPKVKGILELCECVNRNCFKRYIFRRVYIQKYGLLILYVNDPDTCACCGGRYMMRVYKIHKNKLHYLISYVFEELPKSSFLYDTKNIFAFEYRNTLYLISKCGYYNESKLFITNLSECFDDFVLNYENYTHIPCSELSSKSRYEYVNKPKYIGVYYLIDANTHKQTVKLVESNLNPMFYNNIVCDRDRLYIYHVKHKDSAYSHIQDFIKFEINLETLTKEGRIDCNVKKLCTKMSKRFLHLNATNLSLDMLKVNDNYLIYIKTKRKYFAISIYDIKEKKFITQKKYKCTYLFVVSNPQYSSFYHIRFSNKYVYYNYEVDRGATRVTTLENFMEKQPTSQKNFFVKESDEEINKRIQFQMDGENPRMYLIEGNSNDIMLVTGLDDRVCNAYIF